MSIIVDIDHEGGSLAEYSSTVTDGGNLSAAEAAALNGTSYGLNCLINDANPIYGQISSIADTSGKIRVRFWIDPNTLTMAATDDSFVFFRVYNAASTAFLQFYLTKAATAYVLQPYYTHDGGQVTAAYGALSDAPHYVEVYYLRATNSGSSDGTYQWWLDGISKDSDTGIDNYDTFDQTNFIRFGPIAAIDAGTSGTLFLDELVVNNDGSEIGPGGSTNTSLTVAAATCAVTSDAPALTINADLTVAAATCAVTSDNVTISPTGLFSDDFDDNSLDTDKWEAVLVINFTVAETNQHIEIGTHTSGGIGSLISQNVHDAIGNYHFIELEDAGNQSLTSLAVYFILDDLLGHDYYWKVQANTLKAFSEGVELASVAYNSTNHKYLKIREDSGTLYFDYSADTVSWSNFTSDASPIGDLSALQIVLTATADAEVSTTTVIFDGYNTSYGGAVHLVIANATCAVTSEEPGLTAHTALTVAAATCAVTSEAPALTAHNYLAVDDATCAVATSAVIPWYLAGGISAAECEAAYQPIGAASLAASYANLANPGMNNAAPGGAPDWDVSNGWIFNGTDMWLTTGIIPENDQTWSMIVRFSDYTSGLDCLGGLYQDATSWRMFAITVNGTEWSWRNGLAEVATWAVDSGVACVAGAKGYGDGVEKVTGITANGEAFDRGIFIGAINYNADIRGYYFDGNIQAFAVYNTILTAPQVSAISTAMAALPEDITLTVNADLTVQDATCAVSSDNAVLTAHAVLTVADATCAVTSESPVLTGHSALTVADATCAVTSDAPALTVNADLTVADAVCAVTSENAVIQASRIALTVADATCAMTSEVPVLTAHAYLSVTDATCAITADNVTLSAGGISLTVADAPCSVTSDAPALTSHAVLAVADATCAVTSESVTIQASRIMLTVTDATCLTAAETMALLIRAYLIAAAAMCAVTADNVTVRLTMLTPNSRKFTPAAESRIYTPPAEK